MGHDLPPLPLRDVHTVRWYVLSLPACHKGPAKGLRKELDRRVRLGEPTFDFFAPSFVEMHRREGRLVETHRPLLYNYVFIRSSVYEIFRLKRDFPLYNFLPSVDGRGSYPFVSDREMETCVGWPVLTRMSFRCMCRKRVICVKVTGYASRMVVSKVLRQV